MALTPSGNALVSELEEDIAFWERRAESEKGPLSLFATAKAESIRTALAHVKRLLPHIEREAYEQSGVPMG